MHGKYTAKFLLHRGWHVPEGLLEGTLKATHCSDLTVKYTAKFLSQKVTCVLDISSRCSVVTREFHSGILFCRLVKSKENGIGGFHVTSYQANLASHHNRHRHFGFLFTCKGIGKSNKMFHNFLFSSYHIAKLQPSDKNISTHTHSDEISNPSMK